MCIPVVLMTLILGLTWSQEVQVTVTPTQQIVTEGTPFQFICKASKPIDFCQIELPNGRVIHIRDKQDITTLGIEFVGNGFLYGECGVKYNKSNQELQGEIKCILILKDSVESVIGTTELKLQGSDTPRFTDLIQGGIPVSQHEWPWLAAIIHVNGAEKNFICGGTLITYFHVLTAAHCVVDSSTQEKHQPRSLVVGLGVHHLHADEAISGRFRVHNIITHPDYRQRRNGKDDGDIAIVSLQFYDIKHRNFLPISVKSSLVKPGSIGTVVGWGIDENNHISGERRSINMPIVSTEECRRSDDNYVTLTSERTFCAGFRNGSTPCNGDSGGGFYFKDPRAIVPTYHVVGIVSRTLTCNLNATDCISGCDENSYSIFTDVFAYNEWIQNIIGQRVSDTTQPSLWATSVRPSTCGPSSQCWDAEMNTKNETVVDKWQSTNWNQTTWIREDEENKSNCQNVLRENMAKLATQATKISDLENRLKKMTAEIQQFKDLAEKTVDEYRTRWSLDKNNSKIMWKACSVGNIAVMTALLELGMSCETRLDSLGWTCLHHAALQNYPEVITLLITLGCDMNARTDQDNTPVTVAAYNGHLSLLKQMIQRGANVAVIGENNLTALGWAKRRGHEDVVKYLESINAP